MDVYRHRRRPRITHISSAKAGSPPVLRDAAERKRTSSPAAVIRFPHRSPFVGKCANDKHIATETSVILRLRTLSVQDIRRRSGRNHEKKELHQFAAATYPQAGRFLGQNDAARHEQRSCAAHPLGSGTYRMATAMVCSRHRLRRRGHAAPSVGMLPGRNGMRRGRIARKRGILPTENRAICRPVQRGTGHGRRPALRRPGIRCRDRI